MRYPTKFAAALIAAGLVAAAGSAYTAGNTVGASSAGSGSSAIGAYTTSNIQYAANSTDPEKLDSVTFTLDKAARYVAMKTTAAGTSWYRSDDNRLSSGSVDSCTSAGGAGITRTCDVTGGAETVLGADNLTVVATT